MSYVYKPIVPNSFSQEQLKLHKTFTFNTSSYGLDIVHYKSGSDTQSGSYYTAVRMNYYLSSSAGSFQEANSIRKKFENPYHNHGEWWYEGYINRNKFYETGSLISISQEIIGEEIHKNTFSLTTTLDNKFIEIKDDGNGNLYSSNAYESSSNTTPSSSDNYVGNIFYKNGDVVLIETSSWSGSLTYQSVAESNFTMKFDSTNTLFANEFKIKINPYEFNDSNNPTSRKTTAGWTGSLGPALSPLYRNSLTGSGWAPYMTTLGFYTEYINPDGTKVIDPRPVMVARLSQPVKIRNDIPLIVQINYDI